MTLDKTTCYENRGSDLDSYNYILYFIIYMNYCSQEGLRSENLVQVFLESAYIFQINIKETLVLLTSYLFFSCSLFCKFLYKYSCPLFPFTTHLCLIFGKIPCMISCRLVKHSMQTFLILKICNYNLSWHEKKVCVFKGKTFSLPSSQTPNLSSYFLFCKILALYSFLSILTVMLRLCVAETSRSESYI